jgi:hypothetical protein
MEISCAFATSPDIPDHIVLAEQLGYRRAWRYDSRALLSDVWMTLTHAAERTDGIPLGPANRVAGVALGRRGGNPFAQVREGTAVASTDKAVSAAILGELPDDPRSGRRRPVVAVRWSPSGGRRPVVAVRWSPSGGRRA